MISDPRSIFELITATGGSATARTLPIVRRNYQVCTIEYVVAGAGYLEIDGAEPLRIEKDGVYFLPRHRDHCYYPDRRDPWNKLFFVVNGSLVDSLLENYGLDNCFALENASALQRFFHGFINLKKSGHSSNDAAALLFHEFIISCAALHHSAGRVSDPAADLQQALENDLSEKFLLNDYARQHNFSSEHLIRIFRNRFGKTPGAYRLQLRLSMAARLLAYSELSVKEIAAQCGFADAYGFSNSFRKHWKISPADYRRQRLLVSNIGLQV